MDCGQSGCGRRSFRDLRRRIQNSLQRLIAQILRQRPAQAGPPCTPHAVAPINRLAATFRLDMPPACKRSKSRILRMGNLCPGMPCSPLKGARHCRFADHPTVFVTPVHSLVAIPQNGRRDQSERLVAISRCAHPYRRWRFRLHHLVPSSNIHRNAGRGRRSGGRSRIALRPRKTSSDSITMRADPGMAGIATFPWSCSLSP
jgi:hypothetical protein